MAEDGLQATCLDAEVSAQQGSNLWAGSVLPLH